MPIAIVIKEAATGSPSWLIIPKPGGLGDIPKGPVAVVAVQTVLPKIGTKNVLESIVVVIADADPRRPSYVPQSGLFRDVGKRAITIVLVESIACVRRIAG